MNGLLMILLNIPQGVVTFGSAVMAALVMLVGAAVGFALSIHGRVRAMEANARLLRPYTDRLPEMVAKTEILWEEYKLEGISNLRRGATPPGNPMLQERWEELLTKLEQDEILDEEAQELLAALLKRREQAKEEDDVVTNMLLGPGIVLTKWKLKEKELREQK